MSLQRKFKRTLNWARFVRFDNQTGFYCFERYRRQIYVRHPSHYLDEKVLTWQCENLYFRHYLPVSGDVVVDLGAGYGEEAMYVADKSPNVCYIGIEPQPVIYECLANTFHRSSDGYMASPFAIGKTVPRFVSQFGYASVGGSAEGYIEIPSLNWEAFLERYQIERIDLLKMNIEGAEKDVLAQIPDFAMVKRVIISCHDFRANRGEGECFRSRSTVEKTLHDHGFVLTTFNLGYDWSDDWIFAEREEIASLLRH